ncbi:MAG: DUF167 domain-containing protein [Thermoleophilaceae bacterium]|nr:DUF167 domain-containing protein [Thermoleophilaceae bacterium]
MADSRLPEWLRDVSGNAQLLVRLTPRAGTNSIAEPRGGRLQLRVTAAPEDGKANAAACKLVAKALRVGKTSVSVTSGATARDKTLTVDGLSAREVADVLAP